jgi:hypothetical protein
VSFTGPLHLGQARMSNKSLLIIFFLQSHTGNHCLYPHCRNFDGLAKSQKSLLFRAIARNLSS